MKRNVVRLAVALGVSSVVGLWATNESQAFFGFFQRRMDAAAAMYGGTVCNPCGQQLVVNYVPQTCYRVQCVTMPVTTYRPVTSCDPCTGCPTTCLQPAVCYRPVQQLVPYTTYRLAYSIAQPTCPTAATTYYAPSAPCATAGPCGVTAGYAAPLVQSPAAGCATCRPGATTTYYAPSSTIPSTSYSVPYSSGVSNGATLGGATTTYSPAPAGATYYGSPSSATYPAPSGAVPTFSAPSAAMPSAPLTPSTPSTPTPIPSLPATSASGYGGTATTPSTPGAAVITTTTAASIDGGALTPVPPTTFAPSAPTTTTNSPAATIGPTTPNAPTSTPSATGAPAGGSSSPAGGLQPIPDPEINRGPTLGRPSSTPHLVDPQDKTAAAWPIRRAWGYMPIVARTSTPVVAASQRGEASVSNDAGAARLGAPTESPAVQTPVTTVTAPPTVDADGWRKSDR